MIDFQTRVQGIPCIVQVMRHSYTRYDLFYGFRRVLRDLRKGNQA